MKTFLLLIINGRVDRTVLSKALNDPTRFAVLEKIIHPLVVHEKKEFAHAYYKQKKKDYFF